jgi:hypothetical protein
VPWTSDKFPILHLIHYFYWQNGFGHSMRLLAYPHRLSASSISHFAGSYQSLEVQHHAGDAWEVILRLAEMSAPRHSLFLRTHPTGHPSTNITSIHAFVILSLGLSSQRIPLLRPVFPKVTNLDPPSGVLFLKKCQGGRGLRRGSPHISDLEQGRGSGI